MLDQARVFAEPADRDLLAASPSTVRVAPVRSLRVYVIPGGTVQAHPSDVEGLVGLQVTVPRSFWQRQDHALNEPARIPCTVVAECAREFRHSDGTRARTYLLSWGSQFFPIKRESLISAVLTAAQRASLGLE